MSDAARRIKATSRVPISTDDAAAAFRENGVLHVPCDTDASVALFFEQSYRESYLWRRAAPPITHETDVYTKLDAWIADTSVEEIERTLSVAPVGVATTAEMNGFAYTPWQRLSMVHAHRQPFDVSSRVHISEDAFDQLVRYRAGERRRHLVLRACKHKLAGAYSPLVLCDFYTGCGKTPWSVGLAYVTVCDAEYDAFVAAHRAVHAVSIVHGAIPLRTARLVLVAATPTTLDHFRRTIDALLEALRDVTSNTFEHWSTLSRNYSVGRAAAADPQTIVFWTIPVSKLNLVLRAHPECVVPVCVVDELVVDHATEKTMTSKSTVYRWVVNSATPHLLAYASKTCLEHVFGSAPLGMPSTIARLVETRDFSRAQVACTHACLLDMVLTTPYRDYVLHEMQALMPRFYRMHKIHSQRQTITSYLLGTRAELVPASLACVLTKLVAPFAPTNASLARLLSFVSTGATVSPEELVEELGALEHDTSVRHYSPSCVARVQDRVREFAASCPLCLESNGSAMTIYACCGYCVCTECFAQTMRCPFCRAPLLMEIAQPVARADLATLAPPVFDANDTVASALERNTSRRHKQSTNFVRVMQTLVHFGYRRILAIVEAWSDDRLGDFWDWTAFGTTCGCNVHIVRRITGKGVKFAKLKRAFDNMSDSRPMALVANATSSFLIGTDLTTVDAVVIVGTISDGVYTQVMGRIFRPSMFRDPFQCIRFVKVSS